MPKQVRKFTPLFVRRFPAELKKNLKVIAASRKTTLTELVVKALVKCSTGVKELR